MAQRSRVGMSGQDDFSDAVEIRRQSFHQRSGPHQAGAIFPEERLIMLSISDDRLEAETRLFAPDLPEGHGLYPVLASALKNRAAPKAEAPANRPFWLASHFRLDQAA